MQHVTQVHQCPRLCTLPELLNACLLIAILDALLLDHANCGSAVHFAPLDVAPFWKRCKLTLHIAAPGVGLHGALTPADVRGTRRDECEGET